MQLWTETNPAEETTELDDSTMLPRDRSVPAAAVIVPVLGVTPSPTSSSSPPWTTTEPVLLNESG